MTPTDDLFRLIKSLTPNEKGYFKKFSKLHVREEKNNYMLLFEAIEKQNEYDEAAIIDKFKGEHFIKQFPVAKNYLFNLLLKSLDVYHSGIDLEIGYLIHCSIILADKAMFDQSHKFLKKAKQMAKEHHKLSYINKILNHELVLLRTDTSPNRLKLIEEHYSERVENADQLRYVLEFQHLHDLMYNQYLRSFTNEEDSARIEAKKIMKNPLMQTDENKLSIYALIEYFNTWLYYYNIFNELQELYNINSKLLKLHKKYAHILNSRSQINIIRNFCTSAIYIGKYTEALAAINELKKFNTEIESEKLLIFQAVHLEELMVYYNTGNTQAAISVIDSFEKGFEIYNDKITGNHRGFLYLIVALNYFAGGMFKESLKWVNEFLNSKMSAIRNDLINTAKLLEILIFFETGKTDLLHYKLESLDRSYKKSPENVFSMMVLSHLKILYRKSGELDLNQWADKFKSEIDNYFKGSRRIDHLYYIFDLRDWLNAKKNKHTIAQIKSNNSPIK